MHTFIQKQDNDLGNNTAVSPVQQYAAVFQEIRYRNDQKLNITWFQIAPHLSFGVMRWYARQCCIAVRSHVSPSLLIPSIPHTMYIFARGLKSIEDGECDVLGTVHLSNIRDINMLFSKQATHSIKDATHVA